MEFALLGPLEVRRGGESIEIFAPRERLLLTSLLLRANEVVSSDALADQVWGESVPRTARHSLQVSLSRLRLCLDHPGDQRLITRRPGYALKVGPGELDVERARHLVLEGDNAAARGDYQEAARRYKTATGLWRGKALEEFADFGWVEPLAMNLAELHGRALEGEIGASLALGQHQRVISELNALVVMYPSREGLRAQQMLALYRAGRQAEALDAYREAESFLREEIGVDPGPDLRTLHQMILRHEVDTVSESIVVVTTPPWDAQTKHGRPPAERRLVTVLAMAADLEGHPDVDDPESLEAVADSISRTFASVVESAGGVVEDVGAASALAIFGHDAHDDHVERALNAAIHLRDNSQGRSDWSRCRFGVAGGEVLRRLATTSRAGTWHSSGRPLLEASGLARRAAPGEVLVSPEVAASASQMFDLEDLAASDELTRPPHRLIARKHRPAKALASPSAGFVGRVKDLEELLSTFRQCQSMNEPRWVTLVGEPGVGKSALIGRLAAQLDREIPRSTVVVGQCRSHGHGVTYLPLAEVTRQLLGVDGRDPVRPALAALGEQGLALEPLFGFESAVPVHPTTSRERLRSAWRSLLEDAARGAPLVILIEDIHWAEAPLLELLEHTVHDASAPLFIVTTARPEIGSAVRNSRRTSLNWLSPLSPSETADLVEQLLGSAPPPELVQLAQNRAEGYPFFVEEMIATLIESELLIPTKTGWHLVSAGPETVLPDTIRALLAARVELLAPNQKQILQNAAVVGRRFRAALVPGIPDAEEPDYASLVERDLLRHVPGASWGDDEYEFKHALTRDVAYASLPRSRRAHLHAAIARQLEDGRTDDRIAPLLAHHYRSAVLKEDRALAWAGREEEMADLNRSAIKWLIRSGRACIDRSSVEEGIELLHQALDLEPSRLDRAEIWRLIGRGLALRYDGPGCWDAMQKAVSLYGDDPRRGAALAELAMETVSRYGMMDMPDRDLVNSWIDEALELVAPGTPERAQALIARTIWYPTDADNSASEAVAAAEDARDPALRSHAYCARAAVCYLDARYLEADQWAARMRDLVPEVSDPDIVVDIYGGSVPSALAQGDFVRAREYVEAHGEVAWRLSDHHRIHAVSMHLEIEELLGDWQSIVNRTPSTVAVVEANAATPCQRNARSLFVCAYAHLMCGDEAAAAILQASAERNALAGHNSILNPMRLRLALARDDRDSIAKLLIPQPPPPPWKHWYQLVTATIRLEALTVMGGVHEIDLEAPTMLRPGTYLEPFARQALGLVHQDRDQLDLALKSFRALGLYWHHDRLLSHLASA